MVDQVSHSRSEEVEKTSVNNRVPADNARPADDTHESVPKPGPDPPTTNPQGDMPKRDIIPPGDSPRQSTPTENNASKSLSKAEVNAACATKPDAVLSEKVLGGKPEGIKPAKSESLKPKADGPGKKESPEPRKWILDDEDFPPPPPDYTGIRPANPEWSNPKVHVADPEEKKGRAPKEWIPEKRETLPLPPDYKGHRYGPRAVAARQRYLQARLNPQPPTPAPKPQVSSVRIPIQHCLGLTWVKKRSASRPL